MQEVITTTSENEFVEKINSILKFSKVLRIKSDDQNHFKA